MFLKRALAEDRANVKLHLYKSWGDVESYTFNKWWTEVGSRVINLDSKSHVQIAIDTHIQKNMSVEVVIYFECAARSVVVDL
jgi:hypothetical protein